MNLRITVNEAQILTQSLKCHIDTLDREIETLKKYGFHAISPEDRLEDAKDLRNHLLKEIDRQKH